MIENLGKAQLNKKRLPNHFRKAFLHSITKIMKAENKLP